jgi:hypothetical protein
MPNSEPTKITCTKNLTLDNGYQFIAGQEYDAFAIHHQAIQYRVGANRVGLSGLTEEQFNEHFKGTLSPKTERLRLLD